MDSSRSHRTSRFIPFGTNDYYKANVDYLDLFSIKGKRDFCFKEKQG